MEFAVEILFFALGLVLLLKGASIFTENASRIAKSVGVSDIVIGLTLVAFTTSLPELAVSMLSAARGVSGIALGNVVGSNIANIGLVLGISALLTKNIPIQRPELKQAYIMIVVSVIAVMFMIDGLTPIKGAILVAGLLFYLYYIAHEKELKENIVEKIIDKQNLPKGMILCIIGGAGVLLGADMLVNSATHMAQGFGISDSVIGLTLIAVGTSLPELATSVTAAVKKLEGIAIGNIIGSNIFNLLMVMGASALVGTITVDSVVLMDSVPVMLLLSVILVLLMKTESNLGRLEGLLLLILYTFFIYLRFFGF
ncbi:MAG: calcium/sodium antiporter [Candidatus Aenigmarchaeota archaeon]|nr:calcium/sodium antiporter [Candidatus Aenigmarchaeota archaeon]